MGIAEKFDYTMEFFEKLSGGEDFGFNNAVFLSEREAADRNYALGDRNIYSTYKNVLHPPKFN